MFLRTERLPPSAGGPRSPTGYAQAFIRFSANGGRTWSEDIRVPGWHGVSEVALVRAGTRDIVAACRTGGVLGEGLIRARKPWPPMAVPGRVEDREELLALIRERAELTEVRRTWWATTWRRG